MEAVTLLGLLGLGYVVAKTAGPKPQQQQKEGFVVANGREVASIDTPMAEATLKSAPKGAAARGLPTELDLMYKYPNGQTYPSDPSTAGPYGTPLGYATQKPPYAAKTNNGPGPAPENIEAARGSVAMNPAGIEKNPVYADNGSGYVTSQLSGERIASEEFRHNNMVPYFGGRVKQNMAIDTNTSILDSFTGAGSTDLRKKEVETMFNTSSTPFGNPFGMEDNTDFFQSRIEEPRNRGGERPFEPTRVGAGVGEKYGQTGKGGFQQLEINDIMRAAMPTTDKLRVVDKPKLTYNTPVVPGQRYIAASPDNPGEVRKYRPDTFYIDEQGERFIGAFSEESQRETSRPTQVYKFVTRPETAAELIGPAASQEFGESYVAGEYRTPMAQQYGGAGFRNADMNGYYTKDVDAAEADYGRSSIEIRPNERLSTQERVIGLNLSPADNEQVPVHYTDLARPTRRGETIGNIRQTGTPTGYAGGAPAVTVWDPSDVARTTVKESTIEWGNLGLGIASSGDMPTKLKVYDPDDIARPTQKAAISAKSEYYGGGDSVRKDFTSHDSAYNMRLNPNKEQVAKGRKPLAGNGGIGIFTGEQNGVTYKKLDADIVNDRELQINNVSGLTPGSADIGRVQYRLPLKLDVSLERNQPAMVAAVENNPLQQSLRRNAETDQRTLEQIYGKTSTSY